MAKSRRASNNKALSHKVLVFTDMHGDRSAVKKAKDLAKRGKYDSVVYLGDFSEKRRDIQKNIEDAEYFVKELKGMRVYALFGNCDVGEVRELLRGHEILLHNAMFLEGDTAIVGWGGSHPTPFDTPSEFEEADIEESLEDLMAEAKGKGAKRVVMFTHEPPARTKADKIAIGHVGSEALRRIIEKHKPELNVVGHIHEAKSEDMIGKTRVINIGQAKNGHFLEVDIGKDIKTKEITV